MIPQSHLAASSHSNYVGPASAHMMVDESAVAADNTIQQILNQSQLTASADNTSTNMLAGFDANQHTGPSSVAGHYMGHEAKSTSQLLTQNTKTGPATTATRPRQNSHFAHGSGQVPLQARTNHLAHFTGINQSFASAHSPADPHHQRLLHSAVYPHAEPQFLAHNHQGGFSQQNIMLGQSYPAANGFFF